MKIILTAVAALFVVTAAPASAAVAPAPTQDRVVVRETVRPNGTRVTVRQRTTTTTTTRRYGYDRPRARRVCTVRYRNGERIRTCRTRYRRY